jgi:hypothetical protein
VSSVHRSARRANPRSRLPVGHRPSRPFRLSKCRAIAVTFAISAALIAGCSHQHHKAAPPSSPVFRPPPPAVATGIIVEKWQPQSVIIGMIDPTTGDYTDYATFTASVAKFDLNADGPDYKLSEDFTKYSTILHLPGGINHAGWVDRNGVTTDVNANVPKLTAFGYASPDFYDVGFNRAGNFYYSDYDPNNTGAPEIFELPAGSTEGGQPVRDRTPIGPGTGNVNWQFDGNGELQLYRADCAPSGNWLTPDQYLQVQNFSVGGSTYSQLFKSKVCSNEQVALLPASNSAVILDPAGSPDGTQVAFKRGPQELWVVDANGNGTPRQVNVNSINLADFRVIRWR